MPKLWTDTIDAHRQAVRDATLDAAEALVAAHGVTAMTMSRIAEETGIGRATLYKYFPDVEAIMAAWHERHIAQHLQQLATVRDQVAPPAARLEAVLKHYADMSYQRHDTELVALLHRGEHVVRAQHELRDLVRDLIIEGAMTGELRDDVAPDELATYCLHALSAAGNLPSKAAVRRLLDVTMSGLRRPA
ncbi:MAG: TetR/AcrR family transcriptional regulator [Jatrophihabitans sp.]